MKKLYELEMTRNNVTPRAFYGMVRRALLEKGGVELESWIGTDGFEQWKKPCDEVDAHSTENETICKKPFDFQIAAKGAYNVILEFQFDDDERGSGYAYICEYEQAEQPAPEPATPDAPQEAVNGEQEAGATEQTTTEQATTDSEQEEVKMTLEKLYALTLNNLDANDGDIMGVTVYTDGGDTVEEFNDVRDVIDRYGDREVEPILIDGYPMSMTEPDARGMIHVALVEKEAELEAQPAHEFNYDFLSGRYGIFKHEDGAFSDEYETDDLKEARDYLKEETEGTVRRVDYAIFDRDARQYIQIHATAKGRRAFRAENERLAAQAAAQEPAPEQEPQASDAPQEAETPDGTETKCVFARIARTIQAARGDAAKLETLCRMVSSIVCDERLSPEARHIREYVAYTFRNAEDVLEAFDLYYSRATEETAQHFGWLSETLDEPATEAPVNEKILEAVMEFLKSKMYRFDDMDALSHLFELCKEADVCVGGVIAVEKSILRHFVKLYGVDGWEAYRNFRAA